MPTTNSRTLHVSSCRTMRPISLNSSRLNRLSSMENIARSARDGNTASLIRAHNDLRPTPGGAFQCFFAASTGMEGTGGEGKVSESSCAFDEAGNSKALGPRDRGRGKCDGETPPASARARSEEIDEDRFRSCGVLEPRGLTKFCSELRRRMECPDVSPPDIG